MKKVIVSALLFSGILFFANCHPKIAKDKPATTSAESKPTPSSPELMAQGKVIYDAQCGKCHDLPKTVDYTTNQWKRILPEMIEKAGIGKDDASKVSAYVYANVKPF
jgi:cytochrome c5